MKRYDKIKYPPPPPPYYNKRGLYGIFEKLAFGLLLLTSLTSNTIAQTTHTVSISVAAVSGKEGDSGETFETVTGNLSQTYTQAIVSDVCYSGTATLNDDFQLTPIARSAPLSIGSGGCRALTFSTGSTSFQIRIKVLGDAIDEPDETVILSLNGLQTQRGISLPSNIVISSTAGSVTFIIEDDDPTVVSLTRTGSTGAVSEGEMVEFTVILARSLIAGEIIDVPLSIGGTGVTTADWNLAPKTGTGLNTGVTLSGMDTATPQVRFSGAGADTATLVLRTVDDDTSEKVETFNIALGPDGTGTNGFDRTDLTTNVGGGANPHPTNNSFTLTVNNINPPAAPTGLTATAGSGQVTLSWTAPNNSTIDNWQYRRKAGTSSFGSWMDIPNSTATTTAYTVTSLTNGTAYTFEVRAVAGTANGPSSNQVMATPFLAAPTGLTATAGDGQVALSWTNPNNSTITRYQFQQKEGTSDYSSWTTISGSTAATTTHTIARLTNGTSYTLRIRAQAGTVSGRPSNEVMATPQTPMIEVRAGTAVTEGMAAAFTITANPPPASNLSVNLAVTETAGSNFIASGSEGAKRVMISNSGSVTYAIATINDDIDEPDGGVSVTIESGFGYAVGGISSAMVTVKDDDAAPMITSPAAVSIAENTTDVLTVTATDDDAGTTLTYTITGGADSARFSLDQNTGDLAFKTAPDFEAPGSADNDNVYEVIVTASDGTNSTTQTITVTVTDENDNNPMITSPATASIVENTTTVLTVTATDEDAGTTLIYSISGGADRALFNINRTSGVLAFATAPDFEAPGSTDNSNVYEVEITASDGTNRDTQTITVTVTNDPSDDILGFSDSEKAAVIFPNPSGHYLEVRSSVGCTFKILSLSGKPLLEGHTNTKMDIASLKSGLYLVQLPDGRLLKFVRE